MKAKVKKFAHGGVPNVQGFSLQDRQQLNNFTPGNPLEALQGSLDAGGGGGFGDALGGAGITAGIGAATNLISGLGGGAPGSGLSQEDATGDVNNADATPQDLLNSNPEFGSAIKKRQTGKAIYDGVADAAALIPVYGTAISGIMKGTKAVKDAFTSEDEFGITQGQYRRNPSLARGKETFGLGKRAAAINDVDVAGAANALDTPTFKPMQFGKFGMKLRKFR